MRREDLEIGSAVRTYDGRTGTVEKLWTAGPDWWDWYAVVRIDGEAETIAVDDLVDTSDADTVAMMGALGWL